MPLCKENVISNFTISRVSATNMSLEDGRAQTEGKGHKLWKQNPWLSWREVNFSEQTPPPSPPPPPTPPADYGGASLSLLVLLVEHQRWRTEEPLPALCACSLPCVTVPLSELQHWQYVSSEADLWLFKYKMSCYSIRQYCVIIRTYCTFVSYPNQHFDHWHLTSQFRSCQINLFHKDMMSL